MTRLWLVQLAHPVKPPDRKHYVSRLVALADNEQDALAFALAELDGADIQCAEVTGCGFLAYLMGGGFFLPSEVKSWQPIKR